MARDRSLVLDTAIILSLACIVAVSSIILTAEAQRRIAPAEPAATLSTPTPGPAGSGRQ